MKKNYFITGTDTGIGKTYATVQLLQHFNQHKLKTAALKPIASGSHKIHHSHQNDDALQLMNAISMEFLYHQINPLVFELPIAPHLAALPMKLDVETTIQACYPVLNSNYDVLLVEGTGGWTVPLNDQETFADLAKAFEFPVILVVGLRLGCLNHALLTYENIKSRHVPFAGWIVNHIDPKMPKQQENIEALEKLFAAPPLGIIPYQGRFQHKAAF